MNNIFTIYLITNIIVTAIVMLIIYTGSLSEVYIKKDRLKVKDLITEVKKNIGFYTTVFFFGVSFGILILISVEIIFCFINIKKRLTIHLSNLLNKDILVNTKKLTIEELEK